MARQIMLDTGPLGMITHPRPNPAIADWFKKLLQAGVSFLVPEIADMRSVGNCSEREDTRGRATGSVSSVRA